MPLHNLDQNHPLVQRLAEEAVAADLFWAVADSSERAATTTPSMRELLAYARRDRSAPANFRLEAAIRTNPEVAKRYRNILRGVSRAFSPVALAASTGQVAGRTLGNWRLEVVEQAGESPVLTLEQHGPSAIPTAIEAVGSLGTVRLMLPEPVQQTIQLPLDAEIDELVAFHDLIADPETAIFLL